jgi:cytosine/adenosine deaminase-related metal-dependent hydrolase
MTESQSPTWTIGARWVFPVNAPPLDRGTVTIQGDRIIAVEAHGASRPDLMFDSAVLLPGLVNAHTHLDLSGLRGECPPGSDFPAWLRCVISRRRAQTPAQTKADIHIGLAESVAFGVTLIGDISTGGFSWSVLENGPIRSVVFRELLGLSEERTRQAAAEAFDWLEEHPPTAVCRPGLSPHAPYSVSKTLFAKAAGFAEWFDAPLATHLAESQAELELLASKTGLLVPFLQDLNAWSPEGLARSTQEVMDLSEEVPTIFVHANYLADDNVIPGQSTIVYCPRTHAAFAHADYPLRRYLKNGVRVALGTDSLASNPDLSVLSEARLVRRRFPDINGKTIFKMMTHWGAKALGWSSETGTLTAGKSADLVVIPVDHAADPHELVLQSEAPVRAVLFRGKWVHGKI